MIANLPASDHPKIAILFYVVDEIDDSLRDKVKGLIRDMASAREWLLGPPRFVDEFDVPNDERGGDQLETLGGVLEIYAAHRPFDLPREIDLVHLAEVESVISEIQRFSKQEGVDFEVELNGELIGEIEDGKLDPGLAEGLLGEWRRFLGV